MEWDSKYMPMLVPHPCAGSLRAIGAVTGTEYIITRTGTWVWAEDLPGLLQEKRAGLCPRTDEPVKAFGLVAASLGNTVPYRPWPGGEEPQEEAEIETTELFPVTDRTPEVSVSTEDYPIADDNADTPAIIEPEVEEPEEEAQDAEEAPESPAEEEDQPKARRRTKREL